MRTERLETFLLFLLVAAAFLVRIWGLSRIHFWDEMVYLQNAQVICCGKINYSELDFRPPLISVLIAGVFFVWHSIFAACIATAFFNALGPLFLYRAGQLAVGCVPAAIAAVLLAFSPFFVGVFPRGFTSDATGNGLLTDSPALTLVLLAFWLLLRALERQSALRFACGGLALAAAMLMRFGSLPSVGILFLLPLAATRRSRALVACGAGFAIGMAPYLLWSRLRFGGFFFTLRNGWTGVVDEGEPFFFYLRNAAAIFSGLALAGVALAACWWLWRLWRGFAERPRAARFARRQIAMEWFLWLWLLGDFFLFSAMPHKEPRYVLPLAPPLLLLAGSGLALLCALPRRPLRIAGTLLVAAGLIFTFLPLRERFSQPFVERSVPDEMLAAQFLESAVPPATTLYMNFNYPAFAYYTSCAIHELHATGPALLDAIEHIPAGGVLVVYRKTDEVWEPDIEWVDANPHFQRMREFSTFVLYRRRAETTQDAQ